VRRAALGLGFKLGDALLHFLHGGFHVVEFAGLGGGEGRAEAGSGHGEYEFFHGAILDSRISGSLPASAMRHRCLV
jgi:hypothetical protein